MALFFTADTHFGDHRTINIHHRPFSSTGEMDEVLIRPLNRDGMAIWRPYAEWLDPLREILGTLAEQ